MTGKELPACKKGCHFEGAEKLRNLYYHESGSCPSTGRKTTSMTSTVTVHESRCF